MNDADLRLALVLEASGEGLWEFVAAEGLVLLHPAFLALLGFPPGAMGEPADRFFQRVHEDERRPLVNAVFEADAPFELHLRMRHADGDWRWHRARGRRIRNRVIVVQSDISAELQREAVMADTLERYLSLVADQTARRHAEHEHEHNELRNRALIETSPDAIFLLDLKGVILTVNQEALRLLAEDDRSGVIGRHALEWLPPQERDRFFAQVLATPEDRVGFVSSGEYGFVGSTGVEGRVELRHTTLALPDGRLDGIILTAHDITRQRREEKELRDHRDRLESLVTERTQALEQARTRAEDQADAKAAFLANMSHEIRTPMNAVIGLTRLTLRTALDHRQRDYLERISDAGKLLLGLVNDVLDYSKIEAGQVGLENAPFVLDEVLDTVATLVGGRAQEKGLEFLYILDSGLPHRLVGDAMRLTQVLVNLCGNALKFTSRGHVVVRVGAELLEGNRGRFSFSIEDTGIGLTTEQAGRLFSAFSQADASTARRYGGTGLGLMISRRLVQLMGGEIKLVSAPGHGTTFYFDVELGYESGNAVRSSIPDDMAGQSVRIFDDHALAGEAIASALGRLGMLADVHGALPAPETALPPADSVLIDSELPGARDYIAYLRATSPHPELPRIVLLAGSDIEACEAAASEWGANDCLTKPVTVVRLLRALIGERRGQFEASGRRDDIRGHRLLVVDDVAVNRLIISETLSDWGLIVDQAENAAEALALVCRQRYSAILMDVQMPGMDGTDATRRLRAEGYRNPVIALTGHSLDAERERCRAAGMNDVITKPVDPDRLAHVLRHWLPPLPAEAVKAALREAAEQLTGAVAQSDAVQIPDTGVFPEPPSVLHSLGPASAQRDVLRISDAVSPAPTSGAVAGQVSVIGPLPGIDTEDGLRRMQGKARLYEKVLRSFLERFAQADETIAGALREGRRDDAEREAHSLKGLAANIGAEALSEAAGSVEFAIRDHQPSAWPLAALTLELAQVIGGLHDRFQ